MTASMASKNSVDNVYIEQLNTEDPHMERRVLRKIDFRLLPIRESFQRVPDSVRRNRCHT